MSPARTISELVALAKASPGQLTYASTGNGTSPHMLMEMFSAMSGVDHRAPGLAVAALTDDSAYAELIADDGHYRLHDLASVAQSSAPMCPMPSSLLR